MGFSDLEQFNVTAAESRDGSFDVLGFDNGDTPDLIEAGLFLELDELVANHQPSWLDPEFGYVGGEVIVQRLTTYRGTTYKIPTRTHAHLWYYRGDLLEDPAEQANFEDEYGRELRFPLTWDEQAEVAQFFHRPDADPPLYGSVEWKAPDFGLAGWMTRFVCAARPNHHYFGDDGSANVDTDAGIRAAEEHARALQWSEPDALKGDIITQLELLGSGAAFMGSAFPWITALLRQFEFPFADRLATAVAPGRFVDGALVRRPVQQSSFVYGMNAFAEAERHEATYLLLQWLGGARINNWANALPTIREPLQRTARADPAILARHGEQSIATLLEEVSPRSAPTVALPGVRDYHNALDEEFSKVMNGDQSAERAMETVRDRWDGITERIGTEGQLDAIVSSQTGWPEGVDEPPGP